MKSQKENPVAQLDRTEPRAGGKPLALVRASDVNPAPVDWIWPGHLAAGVLHVLEGWPGVGKSLLTAHMAAVLSSGGTWPDGSRATPGAVIVINLEDNLSQTLRPRLEAAKADLENTLLFDDADDGYALLGDMGRLEAAIREHNVRLCVIDPLMAALDGNINSYRDQDVRRALAPLKALAGKTQCSMVLVRHLTKSVGGSAISRGGGSIGIIGAARVGHLMAKHPQNSERLLLATIKNNLGPFDREQSTAWTIEPGPRLVYYGQENYSADDILAEQDEKRPPGRPAEKREDAGAWLRNALADGPMPSSELQANAEAVGISWRTIERIKGEFTESVKIGEHWQVKLKTQDRQNPTKTRISRVLRRFLVKGVST